MIRPDWRPYLWKGEQLTEYTGPPWGEKVNCTGALRGTELGIRVRAAASAAREHLRGKPPSVPRMKRLESKLEKATDVTPTSVSPRGGCGKAAMMTSPGSKWGKGRTQVGSHSPAASGLCLLPYLLQFGAPRQLLHSQGKALGEPQLASTAAPPQQHPPICGRTQYLEAVAVPGFG